LCGGISTAGDNSMNKEPYKVLEEHIKSNFIWLFINMYEKGFVEI
jgi:hypothetical protein